MFGSDSMVANKMEEKGIPGHVNISETTKDLVSNDSEQKYTFKPNCLVEVAAIGKEYESYLVEYNS